MSIHWPGDDYHHNELWLWWKQMKIHCLMIRCPYEMSNVSVVPAIPNLGAAKRLIGWIGLMNNIGLFVCLLCLRGLFVCWVFRVCLLFLPLFFTPFVCYIYLRYIFCVYTIRVFLCCIFLHCIFLCCIFLFRCSSIFSTYPCQLVGNTFRFSHSYRIFASFRELVSLHLSLFR